MATFINKGRIIDTDIGSRFKEWRKGMGFSQYEVADMIGKKQPAINKLETGAIKFTLETVKEVAAKCDIDYIWLLTGLHVKEKK